MFFKILLLLIIFSFTVQAQEDILIKEILDGIVDDLPEDFDFSELSERLIFLKNHPINLNRTKPEELKSIFILSPLQIANFFSYLSSNGKLIDVLELQAVPGFDQATVQKLLPFVHLNESDLKERITSKNLIRHGENDLVIRSASTLEKQKGFGDLSGSRYLGTPEKLLFRYKYNFNSQVAFSLVMEKDAGEKLAIPADFTSVNLTVNDIGSIKKLSIGDYSLQFGQGLTLWSGFGFGKGPDVTSIAKKDDGLKAYSSANEYSFLRGIGTKIGLSKKIDLTTFWSLRKQDATVTNDQLTTLNETGYHRTQNELNNSNAVRQNLYGAVLEYHKNSFNIGIIGYRSYYNKTFIANTQPYKLYDFTGHNLTNLGLHYNYAVKNTYFFGEIAKSFEGGIAFINGILISLSNRVSAVFSHRNYKTTYYNFFNQVSAEAGGANEKGFYAGLNISPSKKWMLSVYADYFKFPWLKFRIDAPSQGYELLSQLVFTPSKSFKASARYKSELKQQNTDLEVPINYLENVKKQSFRADVNWKLSKTIALQNRIEIVNYQKGTAKNEYGYMVYQDFAVAPIRSKLSANFRFGYFNTASYNSRIYAYEDDILYNFSFGMYNGNGIRNYANLKYKVVKNVDLWLRYAVFYYKNLEQIGSGLDEINGNKKSEIKAQLRFQF
ncbi:helix-hairpin-helix domain-containing protein [Pedobacter sp. Du54]|uniref:helix-hairpin-helix domain-containing protein n=1 Tax=Pedobacter anseongensis TaxID=3133439 RepID=UPI003094985F